MSRTELKEAATAAAVDYYLATLERNRLDVEREAARTALEQAEGAHLLAEVKLAECAKDESAALAVLGSAEAFDADAFDALADAESARVEKRTVYEAAETALDAWVEPADTKPILRDGYELVFLDDFDADTLDTDRWRAYGSPNDGKSRYGQQNGATHVLDNEAVSVANSNLVITMDRPDPQGGTLPNGAPANRSGFIGSRDASRYYPMFARYEARISTPWDRGVWPCFWLRHRYGSSWWEIDVAELFKNQDGSRMRRQTHGTDDAGKLIVNQNSRMKPYVGGGNATGYRNTTVYMPAPTAFHRWGVEFKRITGVEDDCYVEMFHSVDDGKTYTTDQRWRVSELMSPSTKMVRESPREECWDMALNVYVEGQSGPLEAGVTQAEMLVDWVHISRPKP